MKLIKLELKRNKIRTYLTATFIISIIMFGFLYLLAYAPLLEPNDKDMIVFSGYINLIPLFSALNTAAFCVLSAVMYSKFIIEDYAEKRVILLFSYPVSRKKIMLSKLSVVSIFTIASMVISNIAIFLIFGLSNQFTHLVNEKFTFSVMIHAVEITLIMSIVATSIGIVSVGIGFIKKSVPTTIISAVLISSLMCNIVFNATANKMAMYLFAIVMMLIGILFSMILMKKVNTMEAE